MDAEEQSKMLSRKSRRRPAKTPEGREHQLINLATDLVEQRMRDGTATAQEVVHFLKLGSSREQLEQERLRADSELKLQKVKLMEQGENLEALYKEAMASMKQYSGHEVKGEDYED